MSRTPTLLALLVVAAAACGWLWPALSAPFFTDDYLLGYYQADGAVQWPRVLGEFARPWFGVRDMYRPLVSLGLGLDLAVGGAEPFGFHVVNLLLAVTTAVATAATAALCCKDRPAAAALLAGLLCVLHPSMVEPAHWVAARTSGQEVAFSALAMLAFAWQMRAARPRRWPVLAAVWLALLSKEGAVSLPVSLLALDLLHRGARPWRQRLALHLPVAACVLAYFAVRKVVLGCFGSQAETLDFGRFAAKLGDHLGDLLAPPLAGPWVVVLLLLLLATARCRTRATPAVLAGWLLLVLLPTGMLASPNEGFAGRWILAGVPVLAIATAVVVAEPARVAALVPGRGLLAWLLLLPLGLAAHGQQARFAAGGAVVRSITEQVATAAAAAAPGRPLAIVGLGTGGSDLHLLQDRLWCMLARRPFAAADHAVLGLPGLLQRDPAAPELFSDAAPARAVLAAGGTVAHWMEPSLLQVHRQPVLGEAELVAAGTGFAPAGPVPALAVAVVEVELVSAARSCRLRLRGDLPGELAFGWRELHAAAGGRTFRFDLTPARTPLVQAALGQDFPGVEVEVDGAAAPAGTRVRLLPALAPLPAPAPLGGQELSLAAVAAALVPPPCGRPLRLYLLAPTSAVSIDLAPGELPTLPADRSPWQQLRFARDVLGPCPVHFFWQTRDAVPAGPACTPLDWFTLRG